MKPAPFAYHAPTAPEEAVALLEDLGDGAKVIAGGQSLLPMLALRLTSFEHLVDLRKVDGLRAVERFDGRVRVGAATTQATIERSVELASAVPLLARATPLIGHFQIRTRGTIGGSLAHADPAAEYPAVAATLDAELEILSTGGRRTVPAADFFAGLWTTAVGDAELLTAVTFPVWEGRCGFAIEELARRHGDFALAGACVAIALGAGGEVERCAVGLFGLAPTPVRAGAVEASVLGTAIGDLDPAELGSAATSALDAVPADLHASADYRRRVGAVLVARAWRRAAEEAGHA